MAKSNCYLKIKNEESPERGKARESVIIYPSIKIMFEHALKHEQDVMWLEIGMTKEVELPCLSVASGMQCSPEDFNREYKL